MRTNVTDILCGLSNDKSDQASTSRP